jgi:PAS domain S-box-containing protein
MAFDAFAKSAAPGHKTSDQSGLHETDILAGITDAFMAFDRDWNFTYVNDQAERVLRRSRGDLLGRSLWKEFPEAVNSPFEREFRRAVSEQTSVTFEEFYAPFSAWFDVRAFPTPDGLSVFLRDVTDSVERRQREQFLADLAERARSLTSPEELIEDAVRSVGQFLGVSRCVFADIDIVADTCTVPPDYRSDETIASMAGIFPISNFGPIVAAEYLAGRAVVVDDVRSDRAQVPEEASAAYEAVGILAHVGVPLVHSTRLVSCIGVHSDTPRHWKREEVELLQNVLDRTWLTVEVARQERARVREAEERRETHERTARTLASITDALFTLDTEWRFTYLNVQAERLLARSGADLLGRSVWDEFPDAVGSLFEREYRRAVSEQTSVTFEEFYAPLDSWVGVRAYPSTDGLSVFFQNVNERKRAEAALRESEERYRQLLESTNEGVYGIDLAGQFTFLNPAAARMLGFTQAQAIGQNGHTLIHHMRSDGTPYPQDECPIYHAAQSGESAHVEDDVFWRADGISFPVSYSAAPILENSLVCGAVVTFADISERKALDQERERIAERERNIAQQLQAALTPSIPDHISGMALAKHYKAALDEAGVGGDFYDVFPVDKGCTVLVVGDLSGKGLAAATQVATVRNMLRYALYSVHTIAEALGILNSLLAEQNLLTGFATLFVCTYDSVGRTLTYVNCGQEPALVRRAVGGPIEYLEPNGPVLGAIEGVVFEEQRITLEPGDALAVFTDGLTEVGGSRLTMLGIDGVAAILEHVVLPAEAMSLEGKAEHLARSLIVGVDAAAAGGVMRDDVCLLVGVVE